MVLTDTNLGNLNVYGTVCGSVLYSCTTGMAMRYPDGTMVEYHTCQICLSATGCWGISWTYPYAFLNNNITVIASAYNVSNSTSDTRIEYVTKTTSCSVATICGTNTVMTVTPTCVNINLMAIGRWY